MTFVIFQIKNKRIKRYKNQQQAYVIISRVRFISKVCPKMYLFIYEKITPKKHSATIQKSKYKQNGGLSNVKMIKSKQLTSVCSYSAIDK